MLPPLDKKQIESLSEFKAEIKEWRPHNWLTGPLAKYWFWQV